MKEYKYLGSCKHCKYFDDGEIHPRICRHPSQIRSGGGMMSGIGGTFVNSYHKKEMLKKRLCFPSIVISKRKEK